MMEWLKSLIEITSKIFVFYKTGLKNNEQQSTNGRYLSLNADDSKYNITINGNCVINMDKNNAEVKSKIRKKFAT